MLQVPRSRRRALVAPLSLALGLASCEAEAPPAPAPPVGTVEGRLLFRGCDAPVAGALLRVAGTSLELETAADGTFRFAIAPGLHEAAVVGGGVLPGQALTRLESVAGRTTAAGDRTVYPEDLASACPDGLVDEELGWNGDEEDEGGWEEDPDAPPEDPPPPGGQPLTAAPHLAQPGDPPALLQLLRDLEALEEGEDDLALEGVELEPLPLDPELAALPDEVEPPFGAIEAGLAACPDVRTVYVTPRSVHRSCDSDGRLTLDEYVKGVVYGESGVIPLLETRGGTPLSRKPTALEAYYKSAAIVLRTWLVRRVGNARAVRIDSGPRTLCYKRPPRTAALDDAIRSTANEVLASRTGGTFLRSHFGWACGGTSTVPEGEDGTLPAAGNAIRDRPRTALYGAGEGDDRVREHDGCTLAEAQTFTCPPVEPGPYAGSCLVGAAERAASTWGAYDILAHYQPYARVCGAGVAGTLKPVSPQRVRVTDTYRLRFRFSDSSLDGPRDEVRYRLSLEDRASGQVRRFDLFRRGQDVERWTAARSGGTFKVSWTPSEDVIPVVRPKGNYRWWVSRIPDGDTRRDTSPKARFSVAAGLATIYVVRRSPEDVSGDRLDAALVVPPNPEDGVVGNVGFLDRGRAQDYPWADLEVPRDGWARGPLVFSVYWQDPAEQLALPGTYRFYVYDYRHPGASPQRAALDIQRAGASVVVSAPCPRGRSCDTGGRPNRVFRFDAPRERAGYNYWEVFHMAQSIEPRVDGSIGYCDFTADAAVPTCVDARP